MNTLKMFSLNRIIISLELRFLKKKIIQNVFNSSSKKKVLLYFKTDPFFSKRLVNNYSHTNNAEILIISNILKKHGYAIDVIDRSASWLEICKLKINNYDLFIGIGSGNFKHFNSIKSEFKIEKIVILATGPEPIKSNIQVNLAHQNCSKRNNKNFKVRRLINDSKDSILERYSDIDAVFYYGNKKWNKNGWSFVSKNLYNILPSTSPNIDFSISELPFKEKNRFLYFSANGLICKGLDLVIEAFDGLEGVVLDVCAPFSERDFWDHYNPIVERNDSIILHGFVGVGSKIFNNLTKKASYSILPASAEGCATSVVTVMRRGVIPVVTEEVGLDDRCSHVLIKDRSVQGLRSLIIDLSDNDQTRLNRKIVETYIDSSYYTNESFSRSFESALLNTCFPE